ncbi:MAG: putative rRNA maturation factor [Parcubacteria group bacterium GW2011_GWC2_42_12]|uniref:Endoribonuclease YbeY n=2 Tax=Candidatus Falkowiibacteriota TaxID=1752728 RepID=A0A1F5S8Z3_9BACT|nr:MAG: putative rRNA maturation factor [Candidatus Falkowbacteria bacterium GW2011_GWA2_41_14]KKS35356.1 MAG: putative rRNA maturation factor [Parcubacteria group bacterium GW2011_GWC2_42_12]OGF23127.1 MAG: rRNA maturation RNase YbeY [Candidatus Falkowbacteria bacterium RIFCSPHIGHO2_02_FULL_42_9]
MGKIEINNRLNRKIDLKLVKRVAVEFARVYKIEDKEISLAFVGDAEIKKINQAYRGLKEPTDVLSFAGAGDYFGEIIIDYSQIKRQAGKFNHSAKQEMIFILVHGLLHLLGHDDKTEADRLKMIELGQKFICHCERKRSNLTNGKE